MVVFEVGLPDRELDKDSKGQEDGPKIFEFLYKANNQFTYPLDAVTS
jgi:hypothetical protein